MNTDHAMTPTPNPKKKNHGRIWTPGLIAAVVLANAAQQATDWSWWVLWAPSAAITGCILIYALVNRRRVAAREAAIRG